ncbi:MAG: hypothetical protein PHC78_03545 [Verrucomicrobiota bacterium]|nr:hypothetical protein [Verrucomicrobiota bacterium]
MTSTSARRACPVPSPLKLCLLGALAWNLIFTPQAPAQQPTFRPTGITLLPPTVFDPALAPAFMGQSPFELLRFCARNGIKGLLLSVRLSLDGVPVIWPEGMPDGISNTFLPCEQLLWEELAFTDTIPFQDGIQPPVPLETFVRSAAETGVAPVLRTDGRIPPATWRAIQDAFPEIQWEGEYCGFVTPSIGLRPSSAERWTNPFLLWQDLLFIPRPAPVWRIGDPRILLTLCGVQPDSRIPDPQPPSSSALELRRFTVSVDARTLADAVQAARQDWLEAPISTRKKVDALLSAGANRSQEQNNELIHLLRTFAAPAPHIAWPAQEIRKAAADPDDTCFALALAALAKSAPLQVDALTDRAWAVIRDSASSEHTILAILWAIGETGNPAYFEQIATFAESKLTERATSGLVFALGTLSRLISFDGAARIESWVNRVPPGAHNATAWCLGSHLPEEEARRAIDQLLDLPGVGTEAKGIALLGMKLSGGPDEIRRLCSLLAHSDPIVAQDAMFLLLDTRPEQLQTPLTQTIKAASVLPSASALAITICGMMESPVLTSALDALPKSPQTPTFKTLAILRDWAARKIQRQPGGDGLWGAPQTLAVQQTEFTQLITRLVSFQEPFPNLVQPTVASPGPQGALIPINLHTHNTLDLELTVSATVDVPQGAAWQIIPRERTLRLAPGADASTSFRLRPPANNLELPRFLLQIESPDWTQNWVLPLPNHCLVHVAADTPALTSPTMIVTAGEPSSESAQSTLQLHIPIAANTANASIGIAFQTDSTLDWPELFTLPLLRHSEPLESDLNPESSILQKIERQAVEGGVLLTLTLQQKPEPVEQTFVLDYLLVATPRDIDRIAQTTDLQLRALGIGSLVWPPCPTGLLPRWSISHAKN